MNECLINTGDIVAGQRINYSGKIIIRIVFVIVWEWIKSSNYEYLHYKNGHNRI